MEFGPEPVGSVVKSGLEHFCHLLLPSPPSCLWGGRMGAFISRFSLLFSKLGIFSSFLSFVLH